MAASKGTSRSGATRKRTTKSGDKSSGGSYKTAYEQHQKSRRQMTAVVLFVVGVLLLCIELIPGSGVWQWSKTLLYGLFGIAAILLPVALIYIAIMATLDKPIGEIRHKMWQTGVLITLLCGLMEICGKLPFEGDSFFASIGLLFAKGSALQSGGVFSALIGWPLLAMCGKIGAIIILVLFLFTFFMLLTGTTLLSFFKGVVKPVKKIGETYSQMREVQEEKSRQRFDIDVDLGLDEEVLPHHPVSSPKPTVEELLEIEKQRSKENAKRGSETRKAEETKRAQEAKTIVEMGRSLQEDTPLTVDDVIGRSSQEIDIQTNSTDSTEEIPLNKVTLDEAFSDAGKSIGRVANTEHSISETAVVQPMQSPSKIYTDDTNSLVHYNYPPASLLKPAQLTGNRDMSEELQKNAELLVNTLKSFGVQTKILDISRGPAVTRYELQPSAGVKISKITGLSDDIALNLASAGVRIEAPIPNKAAVGIEVPNRSVDIVTMREIIESAEFDTAQSKISMALGKDIAGNSVVADIGKMPHMLIAGATGSGKSVCINSIIVSLLYKSSPAEVRFLMIDPKVVELGVYNGIPHLLVPVVTDPRKAAGALAWAVTEMLNRYKLFADYNVRDLASYNVMATEKEDVDPLPQIVIIIDELADLMMAAPNEVEDSICRLAQMARAAGMHLIIATQRPSVDIITGVIKANIPSRIAFAVSSQVDSRTILDGAGAEKLLGRGDMLFYPVGMAKPLRVQGCYLSDKEIEQVVSFVKNKEQADYDDKIMEEIEKQAVVDKSAAKEDQSGGFNESDELLEDAIECILEAGQASTSYLQRKLKVGYARAARLIDEMETKNIVGPFEGSKPRSVLISRQQWIERKMQQDANSDS